MQVCTCAVTNALPDARVQVYIIISTLLSLNDGPYTLPAQKMKVGRAGKSDSPLRDEYRLVVRPAAAPGGHGGPASSGALVDSQKKARQALKEAGMMDEGVQQTGCIFPNTAMTEKMNRVLRPPAPMDPELCHDWWAAAPTRHQDGASQCEQTGWWVEVLINAKRVRRDEP